MYYDIKNLHIYKNVIYILFKTYLHIITDKKEKILKYYHGIHVENIKSICINDFFHFILTENGHVHIIKNNNATTIPYKCGRPTSVKWKHVKNIGICNQSVYYLTNNNELYYCNPFMYPKSKRTDEYLEPIFVDSDVKMVYLKMDILYYVTKNGELYKYGPNIMVECIGHHVDYNEPIWYTKKKIIKNGANMVVVSDKYIYVTDDLNRLCRYNMNNMDGCYVLDVFCNYIFVKNMDVMDDDFLYIDAKKNMWSMDENLNFDHIGTNIDLFTVGEDRCIYI